jgi:glutamate-5-semialdehyde dehydrogenase
MDDYVAKIVTKAKSNSYKLASLSEKKKNKILKDMAAAVLDNKSFIIKENKKDLQRAAKIKLDKSFIDRLRLDEKRINQMSTSLKEVADLADPLGEVISKKVRPNGIKIKKVRVPIGVILIIYEARPNVTSDCIGLLFKTSNFAILRGGSKALNSNKAIARVLKSALKRNNINFDAFSVINKTDRKTVDNLLSRNDYIDLVIPRGGESLIKKVVNTSKIPVIKHYKGVCHLYIDKSAPLNRSLKIAINAKTQRVSVCNAVETILVQQDKAAKFLPALAKEFSKLGVEIRGDSRARKIIPQIKKAGEADWSREYLDFIVSVKVVKDIEAAIKHINKYGSHHTDAIVTNSKRNIGKFLKEVDSACCFANISTRFSDGYQFGLGAEIGISTDKLHARGPMGLEELTSYKYVVEGCGQVRN